MLFSSELKLNQQSDEAPPPVYSPFLICLDISVNVKFSIHHIRNVTLGIPSAVWMHEYVSEISHRELSFLQARILL